MLYERLDRRRAETAQRLQEVLHDETVGTPQALTERDVAAGIYTDRLAALRAAEHGLAFGRLDAEDGEVRYVGRLGLLDEDDEYELAADGLARPRGPALLHGHGRVAGGHAPAPAPAHPPSRGHRASTTRSSTSTPPAPRAPPRPAGSPARPRCSPRWARAAPGGWPTSSPRSRPSRTRSSGRSPRACWSCRAGRAPARPRSRCTAPPTCSTPTATGWRGAACSSSGPTPRSCATSGRCCRRWARPSVVLSTVGQLFPGLDARRHRAAGGRRGQGPRGDGRR